MHYDKVAVPLAFIAQPQTNPSQPSTPAAPLHVNVFRLVRSSASAYDVIKRISQLKANAGYQHWAYVMYW